MNAPQHNLTRVKMGTGEIATSPRSFSRRIPSRTAASIFRQNQFPAAPFFTDTPVLFATRTRWIEGFGGLLGAGVLFRAHTLFSIDVCYVVHAKFSLFLLYSTSPRSRRSCSICLLCCATRNRLSSSWLLPAPLIVT
jgi:hypothetical protein